MSTCKLCGKTYRKGCIAFVMADGKLAGARVCQGCAKDGILLVAARPKVIEKAPTKRAPEEILKTLRAQLKALKATLDGVKYDPDPEYEYLECGSGSEFIIGRIEGLENALDAFTKAGL